MNAVEGVWSWERVECEGGLDFGVAFCFVDEVVLRISFGFFFGGPLGAMT